ncbi:protein kinase [Sorangium cellulosum]|uniref:non-specific serine/threonine protein kinase n=1 Tax=Sorangium cellulosum TaxID=56 RepID=A0A4P2Q3J2_SORCE|nr:serine/threonine-protein kinase [Sorangium cellulosum]AUX23721.1 protein kinase [Sorangium cellulosum]
MTSTSPTHDEACGLVREGQVLAGKYRVERVIGAGGMGVVLAATHLQLEERIAIKLLLPEAARAGTLAERFMREARAAVKIKSEHVARVTDVGTLESGTPYMVMEYLSGSDLSEVVRAGGPMPPEAAVEYVLQACEAIAEAHAAGIVHRDLKPANLFLTRRADGSPCVKVLDFGISKVATGGADPRITDTTAVMGSPLYMSPEQLRSARDVDARTDIWSLGVILFELLTGAPPFDGATMPQLCVAIMQGAPRPLAAFRADVPQALEAVILRCLEKAPDRRFRSIAELAEALAPLATARARISVERIGGISRASAPPQQTVVAENAVTSPTVMNTVPSWSGTLAPRRRPGRRALVLAGAGVSVLALGALGVLGARSNGGAQETAASAAAPAEVASPTATAATPPAASAAPSPAITPGVEADPAPATSLAAAPVGAAPTAQASATAPAPRPATPAPRPAAPTPPRPATPTPRPAAPAPRPATPTPRPATTPAPRPPAAPTPSPGNLFDDRK